VPKLPLPLPNEQPVAVNALRNKRSAIAGEIEMHSREIDRLRGELIHLDATLRLFDPATDPQGIPALLRHPRRTEWFARGEVTERIYEAHVAYDAIEAKGIHAPDSATKRYRGPVHQCHVRPDTARAGREDRAWAGGAVAIGVRRESLTLRY
jgi:hypothetical protein